MTPRVLIVDDSLLMRKMIGDTLRQSGWDVVGEAASADAAVQLYRSTRPDAVTMDIVMPGPSGIEALEQILAIDPEAKVVVVSGLNQTRMISEAIRKGAQDFIAKPFLPDQLQQTLAACIPAAV